jgi:hypothetical protein
LVHLLCTVIRSAATVIFVAGGTEALDTPVAEEHAKPGATRRADQFPYL